MEDKQALYEVKGDSLVVMLPNEVDDHNCRAIRENTDRILEENAKTPLRYLIFDFSGTSFLDSSGIGVILGRCRKMRKTGGLVYVSGESARVERLLRISGIYQVVERAEKIDP